uniref:Uncharacterized protein n=1 Tax=viral metagenome TaxID=1070528 RepID=A0A6M3KHS9_9ZZZZ
MTGRCTQGKRFDVRGAFDGVWVHGKSPVLGIGDTENLKDRTGRGGGEVSVMDSIEERYEEQIAALKHERNGYLNGQQQMQDTCNRLQDSIAKYAIEVLVSGIKVRDKEIATLKIERGLLRKHQAICECGGLSIDHNLSDNHQVSDMPPPCPFSEQIATLMAELDTEKALYKSMCEHHEAQTKDYEEQIAALETEVEQLKFGREPLLCPRADK